MQTNTFFLNHSEASLYELHRPLRQRGPINWARCDPSFHSLPSNKLLSPTSSSFIIALFPPCGKQEAEDDMEATAAVFMKTPQRLLWGVIALLPQDRRYIVKRRNYEWPAWSIDTSAVSKFWRSRFASVTDSTSIQICRQGIWLPFMPMCVNPEKDHQSRQSGR